MRTWLFYKTTPVDGGVQVEFRRVEEGKVLDYLLPDKLRKTTIIPAEKNIERAVQVLVNESGWLDGCAARHVDTDLAKIVLRGRW